MRILALAALTALASGCWSGVEVMDHSGRPIQHIDVGDMSCVSCEYDITASNAVIHVIFRRNTEE